VDAIGAPLALPFAGQPVGGIGVRGPHLEEPVIEEAEDLQAVFLLGEKVADLIGRRAGPDSVARAKGRNAALSGRSSPREHEEARACILLLFVICGSASLQADLERGLREGWIA
jgi:hypothetical protein